MTSDGAGTGGDGDGGRGGGLAGRAVIVVGASSGIGAATAHAAAAAGARVGVIARRAERLDELVGALDGTGHAAAAADVTDPDALRAAVDALAARLGEPLHGVVAAAGVMSLGSVVDTDPARWREILDVNVAGLLATARSALLHLGPGGTFVVVSSMSGRRVASAAGGVYAASKHAAHAVAETLRLEAGPRGIKVSTVSPGFVATDLVADEAADDDDTARFEERMHDQGLAPADVAAGIVHLLGLPPEVAVVEYAVASVRQLGHR
ncbi:SDR family NAD(P)-dependent oxidoreductase [Actinomycetospora endophytica]|uniref:SDR family NAD(P)-dependent oxidoreductase n=1 Tax=Actinomycetospora endophytica TaxID=2291215 RepID=A0ABS8P9D8_9PSEU|nr:SDR family NAD(P)-dependent oxidoreductase [Actinomycetospora endophytica]MCD2194864.1 SDR family NAD(P)-dependent oxidoreductase [Actinomycetospora endophytica]